MAQYAKDFQQAIAVNESSQNLIINDSNVNAGKNLLRLTFTALKNWLSGLFVSKTQDDTKQGDLTIEGDLIANNITANQNLTVGDTNDADNDHFIHTFAGSSKRAVNETVSDGLAIFRATNTNYHGSGIATQGSKTGLISLRYASPTFVLYFYPGTNSDVYINTLRFKPEGDGETDLGSSSNRWDNIYAVNGTIQTSDRREKRIYRITNKERAAAADLRSAVKKFKWLSAIDSKGEQNARFHFGWVAQDVIEIFDRHGLDAMKYGLVGHDVWYETTDGQRVPNGANIQDGKWIRENEDGTTEQIDVIKKDRYTVRPTEIIAFIFINSF